MGNLYPFPPSQGWENGAFCLLRGFILDFGGWGFAVPFYSVQDSRYSPSAHVSQNLSRLESYALHETNDAIPLMKGWKESSKP